jgi:hypothetical protein
LILGLDSQTLSQKEVRMVNIRRAASLSLGGIRHSYGFRFGVCRRRHSMIARLFRAAIVIAVAAVAAAVPGSAQTISDTGSLLNPEDTVLINLALVADGSVTLQTYGFGGGTNAAGAVIPSGGFDPFVGLFSGTGPGAAFIDGTSDILTNYSPGCPPAGTVTIGSIPGQCGDVNLQFTGLAAGTYTVLLSDAAYLPSAVFEDSGVLGDGFVDLTGGVFQTCYDANDCNTDTANWALDITTSVPSPVPEPPSVELAGLGIILTVARAWSRKKRTIPTTVS